MDYIRFCQNYFILTNIPITLMKNEEPVYSSIGEALSMEVKTPGAVFWRNGNIDTNPTLCRYSPDIEYGCLHIENTDHYIVLGPVFSVPVTSEIINIYLAENHIPVEFREPVSDFLHSIPRTSQPQFFRHLISLHMSLNQKDCDLQQLYTQQVPDTNIHNRLLSVQEYSLSSPTHHENEQLLFRVIKSGDLSSLEQFLKTYNVNGHGISLASTPLRHEKNLFIQSAAKIGQFAGIPAGMDIDEVYRLTELYIQECEKLQTVSAVQALFYAMTRDFCQRCADAQIPEGVSKEIYECLQYIHAHLSQPISTNMLAAHIRKSPSYLHRLFRKEMGMSINTCITSYKLERAKEMLKYQDKSLVEISFLLGFSSQSHFQNTFKKVFGITPMQFRKKSLRG